MSVLSQDFAIPDAEVWVPNRPMLHNTLPIPATDAGSLQRLVMTAKKRRETSAMRQIWKARRSHGHSVDSMLGQYKQMLKTRDPQVSQHADAAQQSASPRSFHKPSCPPVAASRNGTCDNISGRRQNGVRLDKACTAPLRRRVSDGTRVYQPQNIPPKPPNVKRAKGNEKGDLPQQAGSLGKSRHVTCYSLDYVQKIGMTSLPKIPIRTLSADWWSEIQKKPVARLAYSQPVTVTTDRNRIKRQLDGKYFVKNSTQTYFQKTIPPHLHTYNIHPEFDSEYFKCW